MNSATVFQFLILVIPAVWVVIRLFARRTPEVWESRRSSRRTWNMTESAGALSGTRKRSIKFSSHESWCKDHYQLHYTTSGYDHNHDRLVYNMGSNLLLAT